MHADAFGDRGPHRRELLDDLQVDLERLATTAVLLGVGQAEQAGLAESAEHLAGKPALGLVGRCLGRELLADQLAGQVEQCGGLFGRAGGGRQWGWSVARALSPPGRRSRGR